MALVCSEMDEGKLFERFVSSFWAEMQPYCTLSLKLPYEHRDFDKVQLDFPELGGYFPVRGTLN